MKILREIFRAEGIDLNGKTTHRTAARAVIMRPGKLLMIYSKNVGDYKFPEGGVEADESHEQALQREVREECGAKLAEVGDCLGAIIEYDNALEAQYNIFKMTSYYYLCHIQGDFGEQKLDDYEKDLGFTPVWVNIDTAIKNNRSLLGLNIPPEWLRREIFALEYIRQTM
jgi:8-oxo-dGTP pyrophosphatase MutT (NUDIX family)